MKREELKSLITTGLGVSRQQAFEFWLERLNRVYGAESSLQDEIGYVAATLAKFSQTAIPLSLPRFVKLAEMEGSDFLVGQPIPQKEFENAGCQFLVFSGLEEKHVLQTFGKVIIARIGSYLFLKAATGPRYDLLIQMSDHFMDWQHRLAFIHRQLIKNRSDLTRETNALIQLPKL